MFCKNCGKEIDDKAVICVHCGVSLEEKNKKKFNIFGLIGVIILVSIGFATMSPDNPITENYIQDIENKVADDAVAQYNIAKSQGDAIQICVQAGLVSAAFLQAQDQENYNKWKAIEKSDCRKAGL